MEYREFGRTGWQVSALSFGAWQLGGTWGDVDQAAAERALRTAFDLGINLVDTAALYGNGRSEEIVGRALAEWSGPRVYVATKIPPVAIPDPDDAQAGMRGRYPAAHVRRQVEASLHRLGLERIDLLQLHHWVPSGVVELDWLESLHALWLEGKIDRVGVSLRDVRPAHGVPLAQLGLVASQQVMFNLFEQEPLEQLMPAARATGTAIMARVPLDSGALSGTWTEQTYATWTGADRRRAMYRGERFAETLARLRALEAEVRPYYSTLGEAALRFALHPAAVSTVVTGMRDAAEVAANVRVADGRPLAAELLPALRRHAWKRDFYV